MNTRKVIIVPFGDVKGGFTGQVLALDTLSSVNSNNTKLLFTRTISFSTVLAVLYLKLGIVLPNSCDKV